LSAASDRTDGSEEIKQDIEKTRGELSETIDAMADRLNPTNLKEQAKDAVREATIGRAEEAVTDAADAAKGVTDRMREVIRENPIPTALVAIGAGWLVMKARDGSRQRSYTNGQSSGITEQLGDAVGSTRDRVEHSMTDAQQFAGRAMEEARDQAGNAMTEAQDTVQRAVTQTTSQAQQVLHESPLVAGGIALALGAVAGLAMRPTEQENRMFGARRDSLVSDLKSTAKEAQQKVERVVEEIQATATEEARKQGLASSSPTPTDSAPTGNSSSDGERREG
jgi:ElaB/YqjD/DUF883 family membrane-anchored ribosome-binding protein